jgi:hypothetical protein
MDAAAGNSTDGMKIIDTVNLKHCDECSKSAFERAGASANDTLSVAARMSQYCVLKLVEANVPEAQQTTTCDKVRKSYEANATPGKPSLSLSREFCNVVMGCTTSMYTSIN